MNTDFLILILSVVALALFLFHLKHYLFYKGFWVRLHGGQVRKITANNYTTITVDKPFENINSDGLFYIDDYHNDRNA